MKSRKGFSLMELLAVIVILGLLLLIAIPSVTKYIDGSRKSVYINTVKEIIKGASHLVTKGKLDIDDTNTTYYIPYTCINMEDKDAKTPYGNFEEAYVVVTYNEDKSYDYYFYGYDEQGFGIVPITEEEALEADCIRTGIENISTNKSIDRRKNIIVYGSDCSSIDVEKKATESNKEKDPNKAAQFDTGKKVNVKLGKLSSGSQPLSWDYNKSIIRIARAPEEPGEEHKTANNILSTSNSKVPIYGWFESETGTLYWWSEDENPSLNSDSKEMFAYLSKLEIIEDFELFDTSKVTDFSYFFRSCSKLVDVDFSNIDTGSATTFEHMFSMSGFDTIDLNGWDTSNVTNMNGMLANMSNLVDIDFGRIDTSNVTNMSYLIAGDTKLDHIDLRKLNTSNVTDMSYFFSGDTGLTEIDVSSLDTHNVTDMAGMFYKCIKITKLDLSSFDTSNLKSMGGKGSDNGHGLSGCGMFENCANLTELNLTGWDTRKVTTMAALFYGCSSLVSIDLSNLRTPSLTDMAWMFDNCTSLEYVNFSGWDTSHVTNMEDLFRWCKKIEHIDLSMFNTSSVRLMGGMFMYCQSLEEVDVSSFDTRNVLYMWSMFCECRKLKHLDLSNFYTPKLKEFTCMFDWCCELETLDMSNFDTRKIDSTYLLFTACKKLKVLDLSSWDTSKITDYYSMFSSCNSLETIYVSDKFVINDNLERTSGMFYYCNSLVGGNGTTYNSSMANDITYARVDTEGAPGLFTLKTV